MTREERAKDYAEHNIDKYTNDFANLYNAYLKGAKEETKELEQENAKLEEDLARYKLKVEALEGKTPWKDIKDKSEVIGKLSKAKELLRKLLVHLKCQVWIADKPIMQKEIAEAEQFLKESEVVE